MKTRITTLKVVQAWNLPFIKSNRIKEDNVHWSVARLIFLILWQERQVFKEWEVEREEWRLFEKKKRKELNSNRERDRNRWREKQREIERERHSVKIFLCIS